MHVNRVRYKYYLISCPNLLTCLFVFVPFCCCFLGGGGEGGGGRGGGGGGGEGLHSMTNQSGTRIKYPGSIPAFSIYNERVGL